MVIENVDQEKRLTELKHEVLARGFDRHPSLLKTIPELPPELRSTDVSRLAEGEVFQRIIFFPQQIQRGWSYVPRQALLFTETNVIHLLASIWPGEEPRITRVDFSGLLYFQVSLLLLYGFLEIAAVGVSSLTRIDVEFNAVYWDFLAPPLRKLLMVCKETPIADFFETASTLVLRESLAKLPLKFSNGARIHGMLPGEVLVDLFFQPRSWKRRLLLFRKAVTTDTLLLLTTNYMVILKEELGVKQGYLVTYLRRDAISWIESKPQDLWCDLTIHLTKDMQTANRELVLPVEGASAWRDIWERQGGNWSENQAGKTG